MRALDRSDGFTLTEAIVTMAIIATLVLLAAPAFKIAQQGFTSQDARNNLKTGTEAAINRIATTLTECKRIFQNTSSDVNFLNRVQLGSAPGALSGSQLPLIISTATLSPATTSFVAGAVGNSLFFASIGNPQDLLVADSSLSTATVRIDIYQFNYYYLAPNTNHIIGGAAENDLWEWHSVSYADYGQIMNITDNVERSSTTVALFNNGILFTWDSSTAAVTSAFYALDGSGNMNAAPNHQIGRNSASNMITFLKVTVAGGYSYGVSPNTGAGFTTSKTVPLFGVASGNFPSGFEIAGVGPNGARQLFIRLVTVAQGSFNTIAHEQTVLSFVRDLW